MFIAPGIVKDHLPGDVGLSRLHHLVREILAFTVPELKTSVEYGIQPAFPVDKLCRFDAHVHEVRGTVDEVFLNIFTFLP